MLNLRALVLLTDQIYLLLQLPLQHMECPLLTHQSPLLQLQQAMEHLVPLVTIIPYQIIHSDILEKQLQLPLQFQFQFLLQPQFLSPQLPLLIPRQHTLLPLLHINHPTNLHINQALISQLHILLVNQVIPQLNLVILVPLLNLAILVPRFNLLILVPQLNPVILVPRLNLAMGLQVLEATTILFLLIPLNILLNRIEADLDQENSSLDLNHQWFQMSLGYLKSFHQILAN